MENGPYVIEVGFGLAAIGQMLFALQLSRKGNNPQVRLLGVLLYLVACSALLWWLRRVFFFRPELAGTSFAVPAFCLGSWVLLLVFRVRGDKMGLVYVVAGLIVSMALRKSNLVTDPSKLEPIQQSIFRAATWLLWVGAGSVTILTAVSLYVYFTEDKDGNSSPSGQQQGSLPGSEPEPNNRQEPTPPADHDPGGNGPKHG